MVEVFTCFRTEIEIQLGRAGSAAGWKFSSFRMRYRNLFMVMVQRMVNSYNVS